MAPSGSHNGTQVWSQSLHITGKKLVFSFGMSMLEGSVPRGHPEAQALSFCDSAFPKAKPGTTDPKISVGGIQGFMNLKGKIVISLFSLSPTSQL
jgi:hypothetical protein